MSAPDTDTASVIASSTATVTLNMASSPFSSVSTTTSTTVTTEATETTTDTTTFTDDEIAFHETLNNAIEVVMTKNKPKIAKSSLGAILKIHLKIQKKPNDPKSKRVRLKMFGIQKNIVDVPGALDLMGVIGFKEIEEKKKKMACNHFD